MLSVFHCMVLLTFKVEFVWIDGEMLEFRSKIACQCPHIGCHGGCATENSKCLLITEDSRGASCLHARIHSLSDSKQSRTGDTCSRSLSSQGGHLGWRLKWENEGDRAMLCKLPQYLLLRPRWGFGPFRSCISIFNTNITAVEYHEGSYLHVLKLWPRHSNNISKMPAPVITTFEIKYETTSQAANTVQCENVSSSSQH